MPCRQVGGRGQIRARDASRIGVQLPDLAAQGVVVDHFFDLVGRRQGREAVLYCGSSLIVFF